MAMKKSDDNNLLLQEMLALIDDSVELIFYYDQIPLLYGGRTLYQAETHTIQQIGRQPGITISEIAAKTGKTTSAVSQIIKKLRSGGAVKQIRNPDNNRQYNLELTDYGWQIYWEHEALDNRCYKNYEEVLSDISEEQLKSAILVQKKLNEAFRMDVERSLKQSDGDIRFTTKSERSY